MTRSSLSATGQGQDQVRRNPQQDSTEPLRLWAHYVLLTIGIFVLLIGVSLTIGVFKHIWKIVKEPEGLLKALAVYVKMLEADAFHLRFHDRTLPLGKFVAMGVMCFWYYFCIRIPLMILAAGRELLTRTFEARKNEHG